MLILNSLPSSVRKPFTLAAPVLVALLAHGTLILMSSRPAANASASAAGSRPQSDNTRQLVRLSRHGAIAKSSALASLSAKPLKAPPPPKLTEPPVETGHAGGPPQQERKPSSTVCTPSQGATSVMRPSFETVAALWSLGRAAGETSPILPGKNLGSELRRLPLAAFSGVAPQQLDRLLLTGRDGQYQLWVRGDQVWVAWQDERVRVSPKPAGAATGASTSRPVKQ